MNPFILALSIWWVFHLINGPSPLSVWIRAQIVAKFHPKLQYMFSCSYCFASWSSLIVVLLANYPVYYIFAASALAHLINLVYLSLTQ